VPRQSRSSSSSAVLHVAPLTHPAQLPGPCDPANLRPRRARRAGETPRGASGLLLFAGGSTRARGPSLGSLAVMPSPPGPPMALSNMRELGGRGPRFSAGYPRDLHHKPKRLRI